MMYITQTARERCSSCRAAREGHEGLTPPCIHWVIDQAGAIDHGPSWSTREITDMAWNIVKDREMKKGHERAYQWARAYLGLEDRSQVVATRHPYDPDEDVNG